MNLTTQLFREAVKVVVGLSPRTPSTSVPRYVSLKNHGKLIILIVATNAETVTGSAISLTQAKDVSGTGAKALALTEVYRTLDVEDASAGDTLVRDAVVSNTFTTDATDDKSLLYLIEVDASQLDVTNLFDCVRVNTGDATASTLTVLYLLYPSTGSPIPTAITN